MSIAKNFVIFNKSLLCPLLTRNVLLCRAMCSSNSDVIMTQSESPISVPFFVQRTKNNNIPVYLDYKSGKSKTITIVRKIQGDVHVLEEKIRDMLEVPDLLTRVDELTGQIIIHGDYKHKIMEYLKSLGY